MLVGFDGKSGFGSKKLPKLKEKNLDCFKKSEFKAIDQRCCKKLDTSSIDERQKKG
jgi:hypothetical protein